MPTTLNAVDGKAATRLPALEFEQLVVGRIRELLSKPLELGAQFQDLTVKDTRLIVCSRTTSRRTAGRSRRQILVRLIRNILNYVVVRETEIQIEINYSKLRSSIN
jgi:site-specific DNA recombinase